MDFPCFSGVRDGPFVRFSGWDVSGHDAAYYPELAHYLYPGDLSKLKDIILSKPGHQFYAFNTNGWMKAWTLLDWSEFKRVGGCDLYVRVDYPGWHFFQGQNTSGNDICRINDISTANALIGRVNELYPGYTDNQNVAAVNTQGEIKSKVVLPLTTGLGYPTSLDGIYVRTTFRWYNFFPLLDSSGNDIGKIEGGQDCVPDLIKACDAEESAAGFNTDGYLKNKVVVPPTDKNPNFTKPTQGLYVRVRWPDFVYLPGLDSPFNDIKVLRGRTLPELIAEARKDSSIVAFNSDGWMKKSLNDTPSDFGSAQTELNGIYVKWIIDPNTEDSSDEDSSNEDSSNVEANMTAVSLTSKSTSSSTDDSTALSNALFSLKGFYIFWGNWFLHDAVVRAEYSRAVSATCQELLDEVSAKTRKAKNAARKAHALRNQAMRMTRLRTSPAGLLVAQGLKTAGGRFKSYLNKYSKEIYGVRYSKLENRAQMAKVMKSTVSAAGRANRTVNAVIDGLGRISKGTMVIAAAISIYQVTVADDWKYEAGNQVSSWAGAIAGGYTGAAVGSILGPPGAIIGGIAGSIIGSLATEGAYSDLANWFFGGKSDSNGKAILGTGYDDALKHAKECIRKPGRNYHVHVVLQSHLSIIRSGNQSEIAAAVEEMVYTASLPKMDETNDDVIATLVWIAADDGFLSANAGNPEDFEALMDWVYKNRPQGPDTATFNDEDIGDSVKTIHFARAYTVPPKLAIGLTCLTPIKSLPFRVETFADTISKDTFNIHIRSWGDAGLYTAGCQWFEILDGDSDYQSGHFSTEDDHYTYKPQTETSYRITFPTPYNSPPHIVLWLNTIEMSEDKSWRIKAYASDITNTDFKIHIDAWDDTVLYRGGGDWVAYPIGKALVTSGSYNTMDVRRRENPQLNNSGNVSFGGAFAFPPQVMLGLNSFDFDCSHRLRLKVSASNITSKGMTWHIDSWDDSVLYSAGVSYLAFRD